MTIQEQIEDARAAATAWYPLDIPGASDLVVAINGYADTMEKLLAALTEIAEQPIGSEIKLPELADFEDAYLICVQTARAAVKDA